MARKPQLDPDQSRAHQFRQYQARRAADGFENSGPPTPDAWKSFVGPRGQRLKAVLDGFDLLDRGMEPPRPESSMKFVRDVLQRLGTPLPELPIHRVCEWMLSPHGGAPQGWREVTPGMAQAAANDGRVAVVVGASPEVATLGAIVYPDDAGSATNPTLIMVGEKFPLAPGTLLQGFRGQPVRFFTGAQ